MSKRIAVISDIHSNWDAFQAVLNDPEFDRVDEVWCLGDVVGRGPLPYPCWEQLAMIQKPRPYAWIVGNHDWGLIGRLEANFFVHLIQQMEGPIGDFGKDAWGVLLMQMKILKHTPEVLASLENLPILTSPLPGVYLTHGEFSDDPRDAVGTYTRFPVQADTSLANLQAFLPYLPDPTWTKINRVAANGWHQPRLLMVGHTHNVCAWQPRNGHTNGDRWQDRTKDLETGTVWFEDLARRPLFANPGSVGFPRDAGPGHAAYLLLDWEDDRAGLTLRRVSYDPTATIQSMEHMKIPESVISQLRPRTSFRVAAPVAATGSQRS